MSIHDQKLRHKAHPDIYNIELFPLTSDTPSTDVNAQAIKVEE